MHSFSFSFSSTSSRFLSATFGSEPHLILHSPAFASTASRNERLPSASLHSTGGSSKPKFQRTKKKQSKKTTPKRVFFCMSTTTSTRCGGRRTRTAASVRTRTSLSMMTPCVVVLAQVPGQLHGGRPRRSDEGLPSLGRARHHPAAQSAVPHAHHVPLLEARQAGPPAATHGGRGSGQPHPRTRTQRRQIPRVTHPVPFLGFLFFFLIRGLLVGLEISYRRPSEIMRVS